MSTIGHVDGHRVPDVVYANASPRSIGGRSLFEAGPDQVAAEPAAFVCDDEVVAAAVAGLEDVGFTVLGASPQVVNIAGPPSLYEEVFRISLVAESREVLRADGEPDTSEFLDSPQSDLPGLVRTDDSPLADLLEGVALEEPITFMASAYPPPVDYWHLRLPGDVAAGASATTAHRDGITGSGVTVVMVDSGWWPHPFFARHGFRANPVILGPAATDPDHDESGHGTGESANLFALAPSVDFTMVKVNFVNSLGAFNAAVATDPDVISCSWGSNQPQPPLSAANQALAAAIGLAWDQGITVVFSAGNGHWGFPGQHPKVISAGGVFMAPDEALRASDYASGFSSRIHPGRDTPDLSGLVGMKPGANWLMLPVEPGDAIDRQLAGGSHPGRDETAPDDGWSAFSGTSAAAPQLAGAAALVKQVAPDLAPADVRAVLVGAARDVVAGHNAHGHEAGPGRDLATGAGLVDAAAAVAAVADRTGGGNGRAGSRQD